MVVEDTPARELAADILSDFFKMNVAALAHTCFIDFLDSRGPDETMTVVQIKQYMDVAETAAKHRLRGLAQVVG